MERVTACGRECGDYLLITLGVVLLALGLDWFMAPSHIATGGVTETSVVVHTLVGLPIGLVFLAINVPLLLAGWRHLGGGQFALRTIYATVLLGLVVDPLARIARPLTYDPLLAAIFGGALAGAGIALVYRWHGSTAGTDIVALLLKRYARIQVGTSLLVADGMIVLAAGLLVNLDVALHALIAVYFKSKTISLLSCLLNARDRARLRHRMKHLAARLGLGRIVEGRAASSGSGLPAAACVSEAVSAAPLGPSDSARRVTVRS